MNSTKYSSSSQDSQVLEPFYGRFWNKLKMFPGSLAQGANTPPNVSGVAAAAFVSAAIGCFTMMLTHHISDTSKVWEASIWKLGYWIPGSNSTDKLWGNIGSYSGKETMLLVGWLVSWAILHQFWKNQHIKSKTIFFWLFVLMISATAMCWHPLFPYLPLV